MKVESPDVVSVLNLKPWQFEEYQPLEVGDVVTTASKLFASVGRNATPDEMV